MAIIGFVHWLCHVLLRLEPQPPDPPMNAPSPLCMVSQVVVIWNFNISFRLRINHQIYAEWKAFSMGEKSTEDFCNGSLAWFRGKKWHTQTGESTWEITHSISFLGLWGAWEGLLKANHLILEVFWLDFGKCNHSVPGHSSKYYLLCMALHVYAYAPRVLTFWAPEFCDHM